MPENASPAAPPASIVCWGELLWDLFPDGPRLGGSAANVAYHAAALGDRAVLVSRIGQDELGREARRILDGAGVDVQLVKTDPDRPTGTVRVELDAGEPRFSIVEKTAWDRIECDRAAIDALASADALVHGTLAQRTPLGFGSLRAALEHLPADCVRVCDINVRPPFLQREVVDAAIDGATAVKMNEAEADTIGELFDVKDPVAWLVERRGISLVALTRGAAGCLLCSGAETVDHPGFPLAAGERGDRVGAGDAFVAVLASELVRGTPLPELAERANRYAAWVASERGAMPPVPGKLVAKLGR